MKIEFIPYTIGEQFAVYVEYGCCDDMDSDELNDFDDLERAARDNAPKGYYFAHWSIDTDTRDEFARCEATGLHGVCYQFTAVYFEKDVSHA